MITKGIRGAISVDSNTVADIKDALVELLEALIEANNIQKNMISHVIFTLTEDLNAEFPAKFARTEFGWDDIAMICATEISVPESLKRCLRILIVLNCKDDFSPKHIYLKDARGLKTP